MSKQRQAPRMASDTCQTLQCVSCIPVLAEGLILLYLSLHNSPLPVLFLSVITLACPSHQHAELNVCFSVNIFPQQF